MKNSFLFLTLFLFVCVCLSASDALMKLEKLEKDKNILMQREMIEQAESLAKQKKKQVETAVQENCDSLKPANTDPQTEKDAAYKARLKEKYAAREKPFNDFVAFLRETGVMQLVTDIETERGSLRLKVKNGFHHQPYQIRLQFSQGLHRAANHYFERDVPISIVDQMDNEVGGSTAFSGAWVNK